MDIGLLEAIGLTKSQANAYKTLIEYSGCTAPDLANHIGESRTNGYKILDKLCALGLASRDTGSSKATYYAISPLALEQLIENQAIRIQTQKQKLQATLPEMLQFYSSHTNQAIIRFFSGREGIRKVYADQIQARETVYFIRSPHDIRFFEYGETHQIRNLFSINGIHRYGLTQDTPIKALAPHDSIPTEESDTLMLLHRTWISQDDYDEPVEWSAYGDKLCIINYGEEASGIIIENPAIAKAFRSLFSLMDKMIRLRPDYAELPKHMTHTKRPLSVAIKQHLQ